MPSYVREVRIEKAFDGQTVVAVLKPFKYVDALRLWALPDEQAVSEYAALLPAYVVSMTELLDADGAIVPREAVLTEAFYSPLISGILREHVNAATVSNPR